MEYNPDLPFYKRLHWQVLAAMILGSLAGVTFGEAGAEAIGWIGELFMRLLRMIIVPLVLTSIVSGVASVGGGRAVGRLFGKTLGYYVVSSFLAASVGLMMVNLIRPGVDSNIVEASTDPMLVDTPDSFIQLILDIVPINFVGAAGTGDMLAIIFFCIVFGAAITTLPDRPRVIITDIFDAFFKAMMALTSGIIKLLPIGVLALITRMVGTTGFDAFGTLAKYIATLASGLTIHLFITLPLLLYFGGRLASGRPISPIIHFRNMLEPLLVVSSDVPGASVFLNRRFLGTTPFEAIELEPGRHRLNVSAEGYEGFARDVEIGDEPVSVDVRFRQVRLDARVAVVHRHRFGSCSGMLRADLAGLHYETDGDDAFSIPFAELEVHAVDYLEHTLTVKRRGGRTYNFTDEQDTADALFVFHRDVERARDRLANAQ